MMRLETVIALFPDLDSVELSGWIEQSWVQPESDQDQGWVFHDIDVARIRLIYDLRRELETPEETVTIVLSLLDQLYEHRRTLRAMTRALKAQPPEVQTAVFAAIETGSGER
jgi:chaperone modulatory protein CbpM